jgi:hypothetical protein
VDVKKEKKKKEKKYSESECVVCFFYECFFYKIAKNKEEFNILICSRSRIMNLHVCHISNIR